MAEEKNIVNIGQQQQKPELPQALIVMETRTVSVRGRQVANIPIPYWKVYIWTGSIQPVTPTIETDNPNHVLGILGQTGVLPFQVK